MSNQQQQKPAPQREQPRGDSRAVKVGAEVSTPTLREIPAK